MSRLRTAILAMSATIGLGACSTYYGDDGYGYGGVSVGYGSGGYYDPYYDRYGYGYGRGYGGGYGDPYYGWHNNYYYPGTGIFIYDRIGRRHRWNDDYRRYWEGRRLRWGNRGQLTDNWSEFRREQMQDRRRFERERIRDRRDLRRGRVSPEEFRADRREDRQEFRRDRREDRREFRRERRQERPGAGAQRTPQQREMRQQVRQERQERRQQRQERRATRIGEPNVQEQ